MSLDHPSIETVELTIEEAQKKVDRAESLRKLHGNREFKRIILEGYFEAEAQRLIGCIGNSAPTLKAQRDEMLLELQAISKLKEYFGSILREGREMEQSIREHNEMLAEMRAEEALEMEEEGV